MLGMGGSGGPRGSSREALADAGRVLVQPCALDTHTRCFVSGSDSPMTSEPSKAASEAVLNERSSPSPVRGSASGSPSDASLDGSDASEAVLNVRSHRGGDGIVYLVVGANEAASMTEKSAVAMVRGHLERCGHNADVLRHHTLEEPQPRLEGVDASLTRLGLQMRMPKAPARESAAAEDNSMSPMTAKLKQMIRDRMEGVKVEELLQVLTGGADVNASAGRFGSTALMWACHNGHEGMVEQLIKADANVNVANAGGRTALILASYYGHEGVVGQLIKAHADVNAKNTDGWTALMWASFFGHGGVVKQLIKADADVDAKNTDRFTALMQASKWGRAGVVDVLIKAHADVNTQNIDCDTALSIAKRRGHETVADLLRLALRERGFMVDQCRTSDA